MNNLNKQKGSVVVSFLAVLFPMVLATAATIVLGYYMMLSGRSAQAVDAAALACAYADQSAQTLNNKYWNYYKPNIENLDGEIRETSKCNISMSYNLPNLFPSLSFAQAELSANVQAGESAHKESIPNVTPTELVLVLDISGSMAGSTLDDLKDILTRAIDDISEQQRKAGNADFVRVAIVPFSDKVSVKNAPWLPQSGVFCVEGVLQDGSNNALIDQTVANIDVTHEERAVVYKAPQDFLADCSKDAPTFPLSSDMNAVKDAVDALQASGGTNSSEGLIWGIRQLTPNWQEAWNTRLLFQNEVPNKKLILMTDGADFNSVFDQLEQAGLCEKSRRFPDAGGLDIELNFIGFRVSDARLEQFKRCAGESQSDSNQHIGRVFDASDKGQLNQYFTEVMSIEYRTVLGFRNK
ncbi:VWA domain-containing protein [Vibrio sp. SCSIO 43137]|uniref:VWA domain-containing protein n=1 Tax=Vibrio sp. SCSIO 43137 TaxID=3021011 RepID=UPI002306E589|nr:VWA domain-containing protein [Vibrio sp. SCSIO 43137]WCE28698.1 VWA domain-containing protein [Vibrio sp. SCSIO 43137]